MFLCYFLFLTSPKKPLHVFRTGQTFPFTTYLYFTIYPIVRLLFPAIVCSSMSFSSNEYTIAFVVP